MAPPETKRRLFVLDDEEHICSILKSYFEDRGFAVDTARTIVDARAWLTQHPLPDLFILDVMITDGNGILFLRELRRNEKTAAIPAIMISAVRNKSQDRVLGLEFGADDYMSKPFDLKELDLRIERILKRQPPPPPIAGPAAPLALLDVASAPPSSVGRNEGSPTESLLKEIDVFDNSDESEEGLSLRNIAISLFDVLFRPLAAMDAAANHMAPGIGTVLVTLSALGWGLQSGFEGDSIGMGVVGFIAYAAFSFSAVAFVAWALQWIQGLRRVRVKFLELFQRLALGFAPLSVSALLGAVYVFSAQGAFGDFTAGPLLIFPSQGASQVMGFLLRRCDLFELWGVWLAAVAVAPLCQLRRSWMLVWAVLIWVLVNVVLVYARSQM